MFISFYLAPCPAPLRGSSVLIALRALLTMSSPTPFGGRGCGSTARFQPSFRSCSNSAWATDSTVMPRLPLLRMGNNSPAIPRLTHSAWAPSRKSSVWQTPLPPRSGIHSPPSPSPSASTARLISRSSCAYAFSSHPHSRIPRRPLTTPSAFRRWATTVCLHPWLSGKAACRSLRRVRFLSYRVVFQIILY